MYDKPTQIISIQKQENNIFHTERNVRMEGEDPPYQRTINNKMD